VPDEEYIAELRRWQQRLERPVVLDEDPFSDPVDLTEIIDAARRMPTSADADWS